MSENIPPAVSSKPSHSLLFLDHQSSSHQTQWLFCRILRSDWTGWSQPLFQKQPPSSLCVFNRCKRIVHTVHAIFLTFFGRAKQSCIPQHVEKLSCWIQTVTNISFWNSVRLCWRHITLDPKSKYTLWPTITYRHMQQCILLVKEIGAKCNTTSETPGNIR